MSNHPDPSADDRLSAFLDGELDDAEAAALEAALEADVALRDELERLRSVQRLLRTHGHARAPEGFAARVIAAAAEEDKVIVGPWWRRPFGVPVEGILVAAAAALVLIVALPRGSEVSPDATPAATVDGKGERAGSAETPEEPGDDAVADAQDPELGTTGQGVGGGGTAEGEVATTKGLGGLGTKGSGTASPEPVAAPSPKGARKEAAIGGQPDGLALGASSTEGTDQGGEGTLELGGGATDNAALPPEGTAVDDPTLAASGLAIDLYSEDEDILRQLQVLASRFGGVIRDASGKAIQIGVLQDDVTQVFVDVPSDQASAFTKALNGLKARVSSTGNSNLTAGSSIKVPIRIVWVKNAPSQAAPPPNAARKAKQLDDPE